MNYSISKWLVLFFVAWFSIQGHAQGTTDEIQEKYWYYRYRLVNDFLVIGDQPGMSIPANNRYPFGNTEVEWGDASARHGWYIGVLATEFKLLFNNGRQKDVNNTLYELMLALDAYKRLDQSAETIPQYGQASGNIPGFFCRDDVGSNILNYNSHQVQHSIQNLNLGSNTNWFPNGDPNIDNPCACITVVNGDMNMASSWTPGAPNTRMGATMSKDQAIHLMMGFALVLKCLPNQNLGIYDFDGNLVGQRNLWRDAEQYFKDILDFFQNGSPGTNSKPWLPRAPNGQYLWVGANPGGPQKSASNFIWYAAPMVKAYEKLSGNNFNSSATINPLTRNAWILALAGSRPNVSIQFTYQDSFYFKQAGPSKSYNKAMTNMAMALSDFKASYSLINALYFTNPSSLGYAWHMATSKRQMIVDIGSDDEHDDFYIALWKFLHDKTDAHSSTILSTLESAPCLGPGCLDNQAVANPYITAFGGWASQHKYSEGIENQWAYNPRPNQQAQGLFNGLDYMLLHNLYRLTYDNIGITPSFYQNQVKLYEDQDYPRLNGFNFYGHHGNPHDLLSFESIEADNSVLSSGNVTYKAGKAIVLKPGFHAENSSFFRATIETFTCNPLNTSFNGPNDETTSLDNKAKTSFSSEVSVYPNPSSGQFTVSLDNSGYELLQVLDFTGQVVKTIAIAAKQETVDIDLSAFPEGVYILALQGRDKKATLKLTKI